MSKTQDAETSIQTKANVSQGRPELVSAPFLGNVIEQCIVTRDHKRAMTNLCKLGIGPWRVYTFTPSNTTNQTYHGQPSLFSLRVCFAELPGKHNAAAGLVYEIIEPLLHGTKTGSIADSSDGSSEPGNIFDEWLNRNNNQDGIHHIAYDCNGIQFELRRAEFERRGFKFVQGGSWMDKNHFAFFEAEAKESDPGLVLETIAFPDDWVYPEPDEWFPCKPDEIAS